jgi:hypothetical protein
LPTQQQLLEVIDQGLSAIITGLEPSPRCTDWTVDKLVEKYGNTIVCVWSADQMVSLRELAQQMREFKENPELKTCTPKRHTATINPAVSTQTIRTMMHFPRQNMPRQFRSFCTRVNFLFRPLGGSIRSMRWKV